MLLLLILLGIPILAAAAKSRSAAAAAGSQTQKTRTIPFDFLRGIPQKLHGPQIGGAMSSIAGGIGGSRVSTGSPVVFGVGDVSGGASAAAAAPSTSSTPYGGGGTVTVPEPVRGFRILL